MGKLKLINFDWCKFKNTLVMALKEKLEKLKNNTKPENNWENYKIEWQNAISTLINTIIYKWFDEYDKNGLMNFEIIPVKRFEPFIGEYSTTNLEITLSESKYLVIEPIAALTSEYDGKLEFYMRGKIDKKVSIFRKLHNDKSYEWYLAKSINKEDHFELNKDIVEKIIEEWLY